MIHKYQRRIFGYECDIYGHLNNANYLHLYEEARSVFLEDIGLPIRLLQDMELSIYITKVQMEYLKGVPLEADVLIKSWIAGGNRLRGFWKQEIYVNDELCNRIDIEGVFTRQGKPQRLPRDIYSKFEQYYCDLS